MMRCQKRRPDRREADYFRQMVTTWFQPEHDLYPSAVYGASGVVQ